MATPKLIMLSLTVAASLTAMTPAMADTKTKQVRHADLDLSSPEGRERLQFRIKQAVKSVCGSPRGFTTKERQDRQNCEKTALRNAGDASAQVIATYMDKRRLAFEDTKRPGTN